MGVVDSKGSSEVSSLVPMMSVVAILKGCLPNLKVAELSSGEGIA